MPPACLYAQPGIHAAHCKKSICRNPPEFDHLSQSILLLCSFGAAVLMHKTAGNSIAKEVRSSGIGWETDSFLAR